MKHSKEAASKWEQFKKNHAEDSPVGEGGDSNPMEELFTGNKGVAVDEVESELESPDVAATSAALEHPAYAELEEKLTLAEQKAHEYREKMVRMTAELDNVRRRAERDVEQSVRFGTEKLITGLLPVLDSLEQALQLVDAEAHAAMHEGIALTMKLFVDVLAKQEVQQLDPIDHVFNPKEHEAMSMVEAPGKAPHTVLSVFQKGYRLRDRIIRPARVIISR